MAKGTKKDAPDLSERSFEQLLGDLEGLVESLEGGELSLEEAIAAYQKGVTLAQEGHARLSQAEKKIEELTRSGQRRELSPSEVLDEEDGV